MIFLAPKENHQLVIERGIFLSAELAKSFSVLTLSEKLFPAHLPFEGMIRLNYGADDDNMIDRQTWMKHKLPPLYGGEALNNKHLIVFPMHSLGDQLYLAIALRGLAEKYPGLMITIVRSHNPSVEKWYPYLYFEPYITIIEALVNYEKMKEFDYYVDAEYFAHKDEFRDTCTSDFFMKFLFYHDPGIMKERVPKIAPVSVGESTNSAAIDSAFSSLKKRGLPVVLVNRSSTGRTRDIPEKTILEFAESVQHDYALIFSTFNNPGFEKKVASLNVETFLCSGQLENDISDLIEIILRVNMVITTDSGITHLSEALKTPCGSIFNVAMPEERTPYYHYSETLRVDFQIPGVCETPCYEFALEENELCSGMSFANKEWGTDYYDYPPCVENLSGDHLCQLLDALATKFNLR